MLYKEFFIHQILGTVCNVSSMDTYLIHVQPSVAVVDLVVVVPLT